MKSEAKKLPEGFLEKLQQIVPRQKFDAICNLFTEGKPTTFRANRLKTTPEILKEKLEREGFRLERVHWYTDAFILREGNLRRLQETESYKQGELYVQNLSSMVPPLVLRPEPGDSILDLTAAPGSKTTQMAAMMQNQGKILANDNNKVRFFKLKSNLEMQGVEIAQLSMQYGEAFGRKYTESFEKILLDAPCSAEGRFFTNEPASFGYWKPAKVKEMARKQKKLLYSALYALRPGGTLVYSTCTFSPEENEVNLSDVVKKFENKIELLPVELPFPNQTQGMTLWKEEKLKASVRNARRILPTAEMEGFFVAKIIKKEPFPLN